MSTESKFVERNISKFGDLVGASHKISPPQSNLCTRCQELHLEEALGSIEVPIRCSLGSVFDVKIADVGHYYRDQWIYGCDLCHLLSASRVAVNQPPAKPTDYEKGDELHVYSLSDDLSWVDPSLRRHHTWRGLWRGHISLYLAVVPSGSTIFQRKNKEGLKLQGEEKGFMVIRRRQTSQPQIYVPQIVDPLFDLSLARYWLQYCKDNHERLCSLKKKRSIPSLRLIDCYSLKVKPAPDHAEYSALSYVWGPSNIEAYPSESTVLPAAHECPLPQPLPAVIADAISVTIGLGFHYLWVDRHCINQESNSKHQQINQMDSIYRNAEVTIIAAAGNGPEYGLPGINARSRCAQQTSTIGDFDIIHTMRHPHHAINSSKWSTRGWTFQEAALSRRRLVFTDDQVYFECNAMNCHESLKSNLDILHVKDNSRFLDILQVGIFGRTEKQKYGHFDESTLKSADNLVRYMGMVEQYTARTLTYDTDSLNAFTGIIRKFETSPKSLGQISQIWGVPFCDNGLDNQKANDSFLDGLAWHHKASVCEDGGRPRRRPGFPSWSWVGWAGEIQYEKRSSSGSPRHLHSEVEFGFVETGSGSDVSLFGYIAMAKVGSHDIAKPPAIHIQALALPAAAFSYNASETPLTLKVFEYSAKLVLSAGPWGVSEFCQSLQDICHRQCIYLGHLSKMVVIMVLEAPHRYDNTWSRVGIIFLDGATHWDFHCSWKEFIWGPGIEGPIGSSGDIGEQTTRFRLI